MKAMTKYQLEHFKTKVKTKFAPMIEEVDLSLRKIVADMTESAEKKLSDKIGATAIIKDLEEAEAEHIKAMKKARTFFTKNITAEQIRSWAQKLAEREAEKTPIGKKKVKLLQLKEDAISDVMESGMPAELIEKLGQRLKVIGIAWNNNVKQIGSNLN
jgi:ribosomal protein S13